MWKVVRLNEDHDLIQCPVTVSVQMIQRVYPVEQSRQLALMCLHPLKYGYPYRSVRFVPESLIGLIKFFRCPLAYLSVVVHCFSALNLFHLIDLM